MAIMNTVISGGGSTPTGTKQITTNGTHDVAAYEYADVQVPTTAPEIYRVFRVNNGKIENSISTPFLPLPNTATDIGDYCYTYAYRDTPASVLSGTINLSSLTTISGTSSCQYMFQNCTGITSVDLSSLTTVSSNYACSHMFYGCTGLTSVDLSSLTTVSGVNACNSMFQGCNGLTSIDLSSLATVSGGNGCSYMFNDCTGMTSVDLSSLTTLSGSGACNSMFFGCAGLTSINLSSLTTASGANACASMFQNCTGLTSINLSSLTTISGNSACASMFSSCTGLTTAKLNALNAMSVQMSLSYAQMFPSCTHLESVEFGGLTASTFASKKDQIAYLFNNTTGRDAPNGCTVHFPSNFDPSDPNHTFDASTLTGYPTFGGSASYIHVAFDLPASE